MTMLLEIINKRIELICVILLVSFLLLFFFVLYTNHQVKILKKRINYFMSYNHMSKEFDGEEYRIAQMLDVYLKEAITSRQSNELLLKKYGLLEKQLASCLQKISVIRYNPFDEMGGNLCYAVAMLDANDNGLVLNGLHNRSGSFSYAKPVERGNSLYALSAEEIQAIEQAKQSTSTQHAKIL